MENNSITTVAKIFLVTIGIIIIFNIIFYISYTKRTLEDINIKVTELCLKDSINATI